MTTGFREEVRDFLRTHLPDGWAGVGALTQEQYEDFRRAWRAELVEARLIAPSWPVEYGGAGLSSAEAAVVAEEFAKVGVPRGGTNDPFSIQMIGNTLLALGDEEQKNRFLPGIIDGSLLFCQGFSEPGHGSDLAGVTTSARRDGHRWIVDGQKIWTSNAYLANWIFVLCRTDPDVPRHQGLTLLLVPLEQPGIEVRRIRMMNGASEFCEVFLDGAVTEVGLEVNGEGGGWGAATRLLTFERGETTATLPVRFRAELERLQALMVSCGAIDDPVLRQELAWCWSRVEMMRLGGLQQLARWERGDPIGAESSLEKLLWSEYHGRATGLALRSLGMAGTVVEGKDPSSYFLCDDPGAPTDSSASWIKIHLSAPGETIAAGTSEVQRNIIAERLLGLPR